jgi:hypothetical protein
MGLIFRKRVNLGRGNSLNLSRRGVSATKRVGPVTVNSRGHVTVRLGNGFSFRIF